MRETVPEVRLLQEVLQMPARPSAVDAQEKEGGEERQEEDGRGAQALGFEEGPGFQFVGAAANE